MQMQVQVHRKSGARSPSNLSSDSNGSQSQTTPQLARSIIYIIDSCLINSHARRRRSIKPTRRSLSRFQIIVIAHARHALHSWRRDLLHGQQQLRRLFASEGDVHGDRQRRRPGEARRQRGQNGRRQDHQAEAAAARAGRRAAREDPPPQPDAGRLPLRHRRSAAARRRRQHDGDDDASAGAAAASSRRRSLRRILVPAVPSSHEPLFRGDGPPAGRPLLRRPPAVQQYTDEPAGADAVALRARRQGLVGTQAGAAAAATLLDDEQQERRRGQRRGARPGAQVVAAPAGGRRARCS